MVNHLIDLDSQINSLNFKLQQVQVCKQSFMIQLEASLKQSEILKNKTEDVKENNDFIVEKTLKELKNRSKKGERVL